MPSRQAFEAPIRVYRVASRRLDVRGAGYKLNVRTATPEKPVTGTHDGRFCAPNGKARFIAITPRPPATATDQNASHRDRAYLRSQTHNENDASRFGRGLVRPTIRGGPYPPSAAQIRHPLCAEPYPEIASTNRSPGSVAPPAPAYSLSCGRLLRFSRMTRARKGRPLVTPLRSSHRWYGVCRDGG
jgi:hypothetical protein